MEKTTIELNENGTYTVSQGDRSADEVTYDEMIGLITQLTMPEKRRCLQWMKTKEQRQAMIDAWKKKDDILFLEEE